MKNWFCLTRLGLKPKLAGKNLNIERDVFPRKNQKNKKTVFFVLCKKT